MSEAYINELEQKISDLEKDARKKEQNAQKSHVKSYFDGQSHAFKLVLMEFKNLRYELETYIDASDDNEVKVAPKNEDGKTEKVKGKKRRAKRKAAAPEKSPEELYPEEAALLKDAKERGVIEQKSSHYYNSIFPDGKLQGKLKILEALSKEETRQKIQEQFASQTA